MIGTPLEIIQWLYNQDKNKLFEIDVYKTKRSLRANAYVWELIGKIANVIGSTKEDVYREYIKDKGIYRIITLNDEAVPTFIKVWSNNGLGWICDTSKTNEEGLIDVVAYYGTSSYNTKQMSYFIDYVVEEAKHYKEFLIKQLMNWTDCSYAFAKLQVSQKIIMYSNFKGRVAA